MSVTTSPTPQAKKRGLFDRIDWFFTDAPAPIFLGVVALVIGAIAYASVLEERGLDAWVAEAPQVEKALNDFYVEDISYDRERVSRSGRDGGMHGNEVAAVNGDVRTDCVAVVWKTGDTITGAGLQCEKPATLNSSPMAVIPEGEPEPARP